MKDVRHKDLEAERVELLVIGEDTFGLLVGRKAIERSGFLGLVVLWIGWSGGCVLCMVLGLDLGLAVR